MGVCAARIGPCACYSSGLRRAEIGQRHRISSKYLISYAAKMTWKEDNRRLLNNSKHEGLADPLS
jgi:hypothetical protein